jgi:hypothetical protein
VLALNMDKQLNGISNVAFDGAVRKFYATLQDAACESLQGLCRGIGMNC